MCKAERGIAVTTFLADGEVAVTPAGAAPRTSPYRLTAVLVRRDGEWRWHTFNGSEPNGTRA
jgi:hypothetical protein